MTRGEFLEQLRTALSSELNASAVQENIDYYSNYISEEMGRGNTEEGVIEELGDPWIIARTIIDSQAMSSGSIYQSYESDTEDGGTYGSQSQNTEYHTFGIDTWWKKVLLILGVVLVIICVISILTGIISLIAPILVPILLVVFLVRLFGGRR